MSSEPDEIGGDGSTTAKQASGEEVAATPKKARKRPNPAPVADLNTIASLFSHPDLQPEFRSRETPADAEQRRKKEYLSFLVKELSPFLVAIIFIIAAGFYCLIVLLSPSASPDSQQRAWTVFTTLLSGVVGFVFGKTAGK